MTGHAPWKRPHECPIKNYAVVRAPSWDFAMALTTTTSPPSQTSQASRRRPPTQCASGLLYALGHASMIAHSAALTNFVSTVPSAATGFVGATWSDLSHRGYGGFCHRKTCLGQSGGPATFLVLRLSDPPDFEDFVAGLRLHQSIQKISANATTT